MSGKGYTLLHLSRGRPHSKTVYGDTVTIGQQSQEIPAPTAFQTDDLDAFDSECNEAPSTSIHSLKQQLNATVKSHKTLSTTVDVLKIESKAKEDKYLDEIIELEKQKNALDNVIYKMGQSMQTMHMLTKPQAFYNETHKTTLGYQNHLYLSQAQRKVHALYCGKTIVKQHAALSVIDTEKTLKLADEKNFVKHFVPQKQLSSEQAFSVRTKIKEKELLLENERLLELLISQDLVHNVVNSLAEINDYQSMEKSFLDEYSECVELKAELSKKNEMVENAVYNELSKRCARMENKCISLEIKVQQYKESFQNNQPRSNQDTPEFPAFFEINELKAQLEAKNNSISKLKDHIATLKGKGVSKGDKYANISKVLALGMYKLDLELLSPMLLRNKEAHVDYLKYTQEHADTLREIVEHARALRSLDSDLDSAYKFTTRVQELLAYVRDTCHSSSRKSKKLIAVTPINKVKKVRFIEPSTSSSNTHKQHSVLNANSELICATCNECTFDAIHDLCVLDYVNDVNVHSKSKSIKSKMKKVWKLTGKVFTNVGYSWKLTGRTFTIDGNTCPLTRITSTTVVPPKKPISTTLVKKTSPNSNTSGKLKDITNIGSSSKSNSVESKISNNSEPNNNWGSNVSTAPSSSHVYFRSFKSSSGTWTQGLESKEVSPIGEELSLFDRPNEVERGLVQNPPSTTPYVPPTKNDWDLLFQPMFDEYFNPPPSVVSPIPVATAPRPDDPTGSPSSTSIDQAAPSANTSSIIQKK
ncbi:hypothetical protein Tco_0807877 [Tanacetum coccineum]